MVYHRDQAHFDRARWRKALLLPFWLAQVTLLLGLMGIFAYRLAETVRNYERMDQKGDVPMVEIVWECTNVGLGTLSLLLTIIEIAKFAAETLTPFMMLFTHVIKLTCAFAILALDIVVYTTRSEGHWSLIGLAIDCGLLVCTIVPLIYSIVTFRRLLKYDDYHHPANVKHFGFSNNELELGANTNTKNPSTSSEIRPSLHGHRLSTASVSSAYHTPQTSTPPPTSGDPLPERSGSYNHKRDTQFEEYVSRRASASLKDDIDRALGAEFGWGSGSRNSVVDRSDSVVGSGVVRGGEVPSRHKSWGSERSLVAVPEEERADVEMSYGYHSQGEAEAGRAAVGVGHQRTESDDDRTLLLGHRREGSGGSEGQGEVLEMEGSKGTRRRDS